MPPLSLLIKPASGMCNLRCTYCFYHDITNKRAQESYGFMTAGTMEQVIIRAFEFADGYCSFAFQGGEPTLAGLDFYKKFIELVNLHNNKKLTIHYALQTNGFCLSPEWGDFFHQNHFLIGISLDGTIHTHNAYRKHSSGRETFTDIMETIRILEKKKVDFNILTVVNSKTAASIRKIYSFYQKNNFNYLQFIPCLEPFEEPAGRHDYSLTPEIYGQFLCELFDLWYIDITHGKMVSIRLFDNYISMLKGLPPESCDMQGICSQQHVIEADGSVYPCDFYVFDRYKLGNVWENNITDMNKKGNEIKFIEESVINRPECKACPYYYLCRGGCKRHRMMADDAKAQYNYFCTSYKKFFAYSMERLMQAAQMFH